MKLWGPFCFLVLCKIFSFFGEGLYACLYSYRQWRDETKWVGERDGVELGNDPGRIRTRIHHGHLDGSCLSAVRHSNPDCLFLLVVCGACLCFNKCIWVLSCQNVTESHFTYINTAFAVFQMQVARMQSIFFEGGRGTHRKAWQHHCVLKKDTKNAKEENKNKRQLKVLFCLWTHRFI